MKTLQTQDSLKKDSRLVLTPSRNLCLSLKHQLSGLKTKNRGVGEKKRPGKKTTGRSFFISRYSGFSENKAEIEKRIEASYNQRSSRQTQKIQENFDANEEMFDDGVSRRGAVLMTETSKKMEKMENSTNPRPEAKGYMSNSDMNSNSKKEVKLLERIKRQSETLICVQVEKQYAKEQSVKLIKQGSMNAASENSKHKGRFTAYSAYNLILGQRVELYQKRAEIVENYTRLIILLDSQFRLRLDLFRFGDPYKNNSKNNQKENESIQGHDEDKDESESQNLKKSEKFKSGEYVKFKSRGFQVISDEFELQNLWVIPHYTDLMTDLRDLDFEKQYAVSDS